MAPPPGTLMQQQPHPALPQHPPMQQQQVQPDLTKEASRQQYRGAGLPDITSDVPDIVPDSSGEVTPPGMANMIPVHPSHAHQQPVMFHPPPPFAFMAPHPHAAAPMPMQPPQPQPPPQAVQSPPQEGARSRNLSSRNSNASSTVYYAQSQEDFDSTTPQPDLPIVMHQAMMPEPACDDADASQDVVFGFGVNLALSGVDDVAPEDEEEEATSESVTPTPSVNQDDPSILHVGSVPTATAAVQQVLTNLAVLQFVSRRWEETERQLRTGTIAVYSE